MMFTMINLVNLKKRRIRKISYRQGGLQVSKGNRKLGADTLILNMGSALRCPSKKLGLCKVAEKCYAKKAEVLYPNVLPYRRRQQLYWLQNDAGKIIEDFDKLLKRFRNISEIKYLRFNESGDFFSQNCVEKMSEISKFLQEEYSIITYGYTARTDLDFEDAHFLVKGSGGSEGNNGRTVVINKKEADKFYNQKRLKNKWIICPTDCRSCDICKKQNGINVIFKLH